MASQKTFLSRIASRLSRSMVEGPSVSGQDSIITVAAASYGFSPEGSDKTMPTGFDPHAAALFEAIIEAGFLVCHADGVFDEAERDAFRQVVVEACQGIVAEDAMGALMADLDDQLQEDGEQARVEMVARTVKDNRHREEVLRIASLMGHISEGVGKDEMRVLRSLAEYMEVPEARLREIMNEAEQALATTE